jgi:hypothetical protein
MALAATVAFVAIRLIFAPNDGEPTTEPTGDVVATEPVVDPTTEPTPGEGEPGEGEPGEGEPAGPAEGTLEYLLANSNLGLNIRVLNDTGPSGEAGRGAAAVTGAGFTFVEAANYPGDSGLTASSVWYKGDNRSPALAVAKILGIPEDRVTQRENLPQGDINVIIRGQLQIG